MSDGKKFNPFPYILVFLATFLILEFIQSGSSSNSALTTGKVAVETAKNQYAIGKDIRVEVQNNTLEPIELPYTCNYSETGNFLLPPFHIYHYEDEQFIEVSSTHLPECDDVAQVITIEPGKKEIVSLLPYSYSYFGEVGRYKLELTILLNKSTEIMAESPEFEVNEPGTITKLWRGLIYQPLLNILVGILIYLPGHSLAIAIIILTVVIRTLLLIPSQKAMRAQARMQEIQPKIEELKKQYANDQARLAQETMLLWQSNKVNPLSSCLPILIQFPILIALYYVVSGGLSPDRELLIYDFLPEFSLQQINTNFLSFDLLERSVIVFPVVIGVLQFLQMQLMMAKRKKKMADKEKTALSKEGPAVPNELETANKMMKYVMPVMIAFFTTQVPAAVGLYWGTSTFYGILQQLVVNKERSNLSSPSDDVTIRVIKPHGKAD